MRRPPHSFVLAVWATLLLAATVVFWDRLAARWSQESSGRVAAAAPAPPVRADDNRPRSPTEALQYALQQRNPGYNGRGDFAEQDGRIVVAVLAGANVIDLAPLAELPLEALDISDNPVSDLSPLKGLQLSRLGLERTRVADLRPLQGMPLKELYLNNAPVRDLAPLKGMPLETLNLYGTAVEDLSPLAGMPLKSLWLNGTRVRDLAPLHSCPLVSLTVEATPVADLSPLKGGKLRRLHMAESAVTDLTPLEGLPLTRLIFTPGRVARGMEVVRGMRSLQEVGPSLDSRMPAEVFWRLYDQERLQGAR